MRAHGTLAKSKIELCHCSECSEARRVYDRRRYRAMVRPDETWEPYVNAAPAREFLTDLQSYGIGPKTMAALSGVPHGSISKLLYGDTKRGTAPSKRIRPETERKLLAIRFLHLDGKQSIPARATWELLDDLTARGFTKTWIAQQIVGPGAISLQLGRERVYASTARKVEVLHRSLQGVTGPGRRSRWDAA